MTDLANASRELAMLVTRSPSVRSALIGWHRAMSGTALQPVLREVAARIYLGADLASALRPLERFGSDGASIRRAICEHARSGGSLAASLRSLAAVIDQRARASHDARAASVAATLSGRLLAALALGSLLLVSFRRGGPNTTTTISVGAAALLAWGGVAWMRRLQPRVPSRDHPVALLADRTRAMVEAGVDLRKALLSAAEVSEDDGLKVIVDRVHLGMACDISLTRSADPAHRVLGSICKQGGSAGLPISDALAGFAAELRERQAREHALAARRAPVLLVLPLTLCFLPAFGLVMVLPLIRSVTG